MMVGDRAPSAPGCSRKPMLSRMAVAVAAAIRWKIRLLAVSEGSRPSWGSAFPGDGLLFRSGWFGLGGGGVRCECLFKRGSGFGV
jgi:hypothetical protein